MKPLLFILLFFMICLALSSKAQNGYPTDDSIRTALQKTGSRFESARAIVWLESVEDSGNVLDFLRDLDKGIAAIEQFTGRRFDTAYYGQEKIEYYISRYTGASHVYNGYEHNAARNPPAIFFSVKRYRNNALPWLHETTHLILREFHSLWLREGLAEWIAEQVGRELGKGHVAFYGDREAESVHVLATSINNHPGREIILNLVGKDGIPVFKNAEIRRLFYIGSTSFVHYLAAMLTKKRLLQLYAADSTAVACEKATGIPMDQIRAEWFRSILTLDNSRTALQ